MPTNWIVYENAPVYVGTYTSASSNYTMTMTPPAPVDKPTALDWLHRQTEQICALAREAA